MVYLIYSLIFFIFAWVFTNQRNPKYSLYGFCFFSIVLFWGLSYINALDTPGYIEKFNYDIQTIPGYIDRQYEIGYTLLAMLFKTVYPQYWFFQLVVFGIECFLIIKGLQYYFDDKQLIFIIPLLFFLYPTNLFAFRQGIATSLFIYALHYINAESFKKSLLFFVFIGTAFLFHQSAIILIIVYPLRYAKKIVSNNWIIFTILLLGDLLWATGLSILSQFDFLLPLFYGDILDMGEKYIRIYEGANQTGTFGLAKVLEVNITVLLYTLYCEQDKENEAFRFNLLIFLIIGLYIGGFVAHRLNYYWTILYYVCFVRSVMSIPAFKESKSLSYFLIAIYMFWFYIIKSDYMHEEYLLLFNF